MEYEIKTLAELPPPEKEAAIFLFIDGFYNIFSMGVSKDKTILKDLFIDAFDEHLVYLCLADGKVAGFLALGNAEKRPIQLCKETCQRLLGKFSGALVYKQMGDVLHEITITDPNEGYIDFLTTHADARGQGIATKLISYVCENLAYSCYSLEVLSKNTNAKKLYEHLGFVPVRKKKNLLIMLSGMGHPIVMRLEVKH